MLTVTMVTNVIGVYNWLSSYGPSVFTDDEDIDGLSVTCGKIGQFSGDVLMRLRGEETEVVNVSDVSCYTRAVYTLYLSEGSTNSGQAISVFLCKNKTSELWCITVMVDRCALSKEAARNKQNRTIPESTKYSKITTVGTAASITSLELEDLLQRLCELSLNNDFEIKRCSQCIGPHFEPPQQDPPCIGPVVPGVRTVPLMLSFEELKENIGITCGFQGEKAQYKFLKLTRREITYLIGKRGTKIARIRADSGASVRIVPLNTAVNGVGKIVTGLQLTQYLRLSGTPAAVAHALELIEFAVYEYRVHGRERY